MLKIKYLILFSFLFFSIISYGQFTDDINSNRPGESMSAFSVGKTVLQAELGIYALKEKHDLLDNEISGFGSNLDLRYGAFLEQLELHLNLQYQKANFTTRNVDNYFRLKKTIIGAKYLLYDPMKNYEKKINVYSWKSNHKFNYRQFIPAIGIYAGVNINLSNDILSRPGIPADPKISPKFMILTQNQFGNVVLISNIILDKFSSNKQSIDYVVTITRGITSRWSGLIEIQGFNGDYYSDAFLRGGAAFLVQENLQIDASIGKNYKNTPSILNGGIGVSWRFDNNYNEMLLRVHKEKKDEKGKDKKGKKDKKKDKAKKRLDEVGGEKIK
ncbi:transporter [Flavobacterium psychrotolerans]|uniref:Transporter n=1 Tax=Flavobacterium psychrotolerans TaxID=2169410 RepID=A0A2U1JKZ3_9FLAO|nr:transporter [Flavobacterium psychrotolerans]PWA05836.1 hypothetical protein DB895_05260 [Flavobacterium psychrotolerans]